MDEKELNELLKAKYEKFRKIALIAGYIFLSTAVIFTLLGIILDKPDILLGVILQIIAGIILIANNRKRG